MKGRNDRGEGNSAKERKLTGKEVRKGHEVKKKGRSLDRIKGGRRIRDSAKYT